MTIYMLNKIIKKGLLLPLLLAVCSCSYRYSIKKSNIQTVISLIDKNYKIYSANSCININFSKPLDSAHTLGDPNVFDYNQPAVTTIGNCKYIDSVPREVITFCQKYKLYKVSIYYWQNEDDEIPVIEFTREPQGFFGNNYRVLYTKGDDIYYPYKHKKYRLKGNIILIKTSADIM